MRGLKEVLADRVLMDQIGEAVREAGRQMTGIRVGENEIEKKEGRSNFVTRYDRRNQEYLQERFGKLLPEAAFVGEEDQEHRDRLPDGFVWIVDPIDGTTNFLFDLHIRIKRSGKFALGALDANDVAFDLDVDVGRYDDGQFAYS